MANLALLCLGEGLPVGDVPVEVAATPEPIRTSNPTEFTRRLGRVGIPELTWVLADDEAATGAEARYV